MDYAETIEALLGLENRLVAVDTTITKPADDVKPEHLRSSMGGVLRLAELARPDEKRPVDEAAWWTRSRGKAVLCLEPDVGMLIDRRRFRSARWDGDRLTIEMGSMVHQVVPLVRVDGEAVERTYSRAGG